MLVTSFYDRFANILTYEILEASNIYLNAVYIFLCAKSTCRILLQFTFLKSLIFFSRRHENYFYEVIRAIGTSTCKNGITFEEISRLHQQRHRCHFRSPRRARGQMHRVHFRAFQRIEEQLWNIQEELSFLLYAADRVILPPSRGRGRMHFLTGFVSIWHEPYGGKFHLRKSVYTANNACHGSCDASIFRMQFASLARGEPFTIQRISIKSQSRRAV